MYGEPERISPLPKFEPQKQIFVEPKHMANRHRFIRQELYELVWSEPLKQLAVQFEISDVGLAKACRRNNIPRPVLLNN